VGMVAGIDWASEVHVACVVDGDGVVASRLSFTHDGAAIGAMVRRLRAASMAGWRSSGVIARLSRH
jgi:transposase